MGSKKCFTWNIFQAPGDHEDQGFEENAEVYFPMQKSLKMTSRMSSTSTRPVRRPKA